MEVTVGKAPGVDAPDVGTKTMTAFDGVPVGLPAASVGVTTPVVV